MKAKCVSFSSRVISSLMVFGSLQALSASAMAQETLLCQTQNDRKVVSISITFEPTQSARGLSGTYIYDSQWNGAFPTDDRDSGVANGTLSTNEQGIEAHFEFISFDVPTVLEVHQSIGEVIIGSDQGQDVDAGLKCSLSQTS